MDFNTPPITIDPNTPPIIKLMDPQVPRPRITQITDNLYLSDARGGNSLQILEEKGITAIVTLLPTTGPIWDDPNFRTHFPPSQRLHIPCEDSHTQNILVYLEEICAFIDKQISAGVGGPSRSKESEEYMAQFNIKQLEVLRKVSEQTWTRGPTKVLIHCEKGYSRSPTVLIAYLMRKNRLPLDTVMEQVKSKRDVGPNPNFMDQLQVWEKVGYNLWADEEKEEPKGPYAEYLYRRVERNIGIRKD